MRLDLSKVRTARERYDKVYEPGAFSDESDGFRVAAPVALAFDILKDKEHFHLVGRVRTSLELRCSRCLEAFTTPVEASFDLRYQPRAAAGEEEAEHDRSLDDGDMSAAFYENEEIDLGELMREQLYLALPMKPLCRDDCKGLCPLCGTNFNHGTCGCTRDWVDPRLAALKTLKRDS